MRSKPGGILLATFAGMLVLSNAMGQDFPSRPIRLVSPSAPSTSTDIMARIIAPFMSKSLGQPVVVENKAGADMMSGLEYIAKTQPADGYSIVVASPTNQVMIPLTMKDLRFDPLKDIIPFITLAETTQAFGSAGSLPWKNYNEFVAHAKANPGKLNFGASTAALRLMTEVILRKEGINVVHIPYASGGIYIQALTSGADIQAGFLTLVAAAGLGDKFRVLAITGGKRNTRMPEVPTMGELGLSKIPTLQYTLNVRTGTPSSIVQRLYVVSSQVIQQPEVRALLEKSYFTILNEDPQASAKALAEQAAFFGDVAKQVGIQPN